MAYQRIQPFPAPDTYQFPELRALTSVWKERRAALEGDGAYKDFIKKLQREWAIETGIIERLYTWDRGVTEVLIEQGIEASIISHRGGVSQRDAEHIQALITDHLDIVEGLFGYVKGEEPLTEHFIRGLQAQFTAHQDTTEAMTPSGDRIQVQLLKGEYKTQPNNPKRPDGPIHAYCPPERTKEEMESLIGMYREAEPSYSPEVKSAWLHHRFTQIHPFQDGNGRVARALASLVFLREGLFPLVVRESDRPEYIGSLEAADAGDLGPLVKFFARRQRDSILKALGLEQQAQQSQQADLIITAALEQLKRRFSKEKQKVSAVYTHAEKLFALAEEKFKALARTLDPELRRLTLPQMAGPYHARSNSANSTSDKRHYFQKQIAEVAQKFDYFANFEHHRTWVRLTVATDQEFDYVVSFHGYGPSDAGILAASAFTSLRAPREEGGTEPVALQAVADLFQFNYAETLGTTEARFLEWLESSTVVAMAAWKRSLHA